MGNNNQIPAILMPDRISYTLDLKFYGS